MRREEKARNSTRFRAKHSAVFTETRELEKYHSIDVELSPFRFEINQSFRTKGFKLSKIGLLIGRRFNSNKLQWKERKEQTG